MGPGSYDGMLIENFENFDSLIKLIIRLLSKILGSVYTCKLSSCISITATPYAKLARKRIAYWGKYHIEQWLTGEALQVRKCLAITLSMINRPNLATTCRYYVCKIHYEASHEYNRIQSHFHTSGRLAFNFSKQYPCIQRNYLFMQSSYSLNFTFSCGIKAQRSGQVKTWPTSHW